MQVNAKANQIARLFTALARQGWSKETSSDPEVWTPENPYWGQCAVTACVAQDYLGGNIVWAEAETPDGRRISHYFNVIEGQEVDFTRHQFPVGTVIPAGVEKKKTFSSTREYVLSFEVTQQRYEKLRANLREFLPQD